MSFSFWFNVIITLGSLYGAWLDHGETWKAYKELLPGSEKSKKLRKFLLLWGIPLISFIALPFTWAEADSSDRQMRNLGEQVSRNDPLTKPMATASAFASIVTSQNPRPMSLFNLPPENPEWSASIMFIQGTNLNSNSLLKVVASKDDVSAWNMGSSSNREWRIQFKENLLSHLSFESDKSTILVKHFNEVNALVLAMPFETNMVVERGFVVLTVNDSKWRFDIPRQKPNWGIISMTQSRENSGNMTASVLRVPIADWVHPPRFTNRWYDGQ